MRLGIHTLLRHRKYEDRPLAIPTCLGHFQIERRVLVQTAERREGNLVGGLRTGTTGLAPSEGSGALWHRSRRYVAIISLVARGEKEETTL
jgi:hypothetical protein